MVFGEVKNKNSFRVLSEGVNGITSRYCHQETEHAYAINITESMNAILSLERIDAKSSNEHE